MFAGDAPFSIDLVYAQAGHPHNHFPGLYHPQARLLVHRLLLPTILCAARLAQRANVTLQVLDCFRPVEAQETMAQHGYLPELIMPPGTGAHPRGLAVDVQLLDAAGQLLDMGTPFDFFTDDLANNPAARDWPDLTPEQRANRRLLDDIMREASDDFDLIGLPQEWWDYRAPRHVYEQYAPMREADLPPALRMTRDPAPPSPELQRQWQQTRAEILAAL